MTSYLRSFWTKKEPQKEPGSKDEQSPLLTRGPGQTGGAMNTMMSTKMGAGGGYGYTQMRQADAPPKNLNPITGKGPTWLKTFCSRCFLPLIFVPYLAFVGVELAIVFLYAIEPAVVMLLVLCALAVNLAFIGMTAFEGYVDQDVHKHRVGGRRLLTLVSLLSVLVSLISGCVSGASAFDAYFYPFQSFTLNAQYTNVMPSGLAAAREDAGALVFAEDSRVETTSTIGFKAGTTYCVAPILDSRVTQVQYWAVGKDCCKVRSDFTCSDALSKTAHSGIVVRNSPLKLFGDDQEIFMDAVKQSEEVYGFTSAEHPLFVRWVDDLEAANKEDLKAGIKALIWNSVYCFLALAIIGPTIFYGGKSAADKRKAGEFAAD